jgi:hypothetical protein
MTWIADGAQALTEPFSSLRSIAPRAKSRRQVVHFGAHSTERRLGPPSWGRALYAPLGTRKGSTAFFHE